ncbi:coiled-coil domain-containing protein [Paraliomyxa miuraensis]|uniref:hypothetical protein n=1 Tax=Paraliomyxa miuraensis TaxID=376150 RepID=UPI002257ECA0|nr:hypothetical protein [Paraliomyxa miuraensis]MCX4242286.1 hypothetical protein [Paraliomyxa miuraensis]
MTTLQEPKTRQDIQREFDALLRRQQARASQIATKAEEAEQRKHRELVQKAAAYTVESIVNDLAKLQLGFGRAVDEIAGQLDAETSKLGQLRRAIEVERARLEQLQGTVVAAEALALLEQDHGRSLAELDERVAQSRKALSDETAATREGWKKQEEEAQRANEEQAEQLAKQRKLAEEERGYEHNRLAQVQADQRAVQRREVERELAEQEASKTKDWAARDKVLSDDAGRIEELRTKVAGFAEALDKAAKDAREKAIASVHRDAKHEQELLVKQHESDIKVFELKVQTLEERIARQASLITELSSKLDSTIAKSQDLASQAFHHNA